MAIQPCRLLKSSASFWTGVGVLSIMSIILTCTPPNTNAQLIFNQPEIYIWDDKTSYNPYNPLTPFQQMLLEYIKVSRYETSLDGNEIWSIFRLVYYDPFISGLPIAKQNLAKEYYWKFLNSTGTFPGATIFNTTLKEKFPFGAKPNDVIAFHAIADKGYLSHEMSPNWDMKFEFPPGSGTIVRSRTLVDILSFSLPRWRYGTQPSKSFETIIKEELSTHPSFLINRYLDKQELNYFYDVSASSVETLINPCIKELFVNYIISWHYHITYVQKVYLTIPFLSEDKVDILGELEDWWDITEVFCTFYEFDCSVVEKLIMTNNHLLALTNLGIYVSDPMQVQDTVFGRFLEKPLLGFHLYDPCFEVRDLLYCFDSDEFGESLAHSIDLQYLPSCVLSQEPNRHDYVILIVHHDVPGEGGLSQPRKAVTVFYAEEPYMKWQLLIRSVPQFYERDLSIRQLKSIFYNHQLNHFDAVVTVHSEKEGSDNSIRFVIPKKHEVGAYYTELHHDMGKGFLHFKFPRSFYFTKVEVEPISMDTFFLGNQLWIAETAGSHIYRSVTKVTHGGLIEYCRFNHPDRHFLCINEQHTILLLGKMSVNYAPSEVYAASLPNVRTVMKEEPWYIDPEYYQLDSSADINRKVKEFVTVSNKAVILKALSGAHFMMSHVGNIQMWYLQGSSRHDSTIFGLVVRENFMTRVIERTGLETKIVKMFRPIEVPGFNPQKDQGIYSDPKYIFEANIQEKVKSETECLYCKIQYRKPNYGTCGPPLQIPALKDNCPTSGPLPQSFDPYVDIVIKSDKPYVRCKCNSDHWDKKTCKESINLATEAPLFSSLPRGMDQKRYCLTTNSIFDPNGRSVIPFAPLHTSGPLVPFLVDAITVVLYEAKLDPVKSKGFKGNYLSKVYGGRTIVCTHLKRKSSLEDSVLEEECNLYIRHIKELENPLDKHEWLPGFHSAVYAYIVQSFKMYALECYVYVNIVEASNTAFIYIKRGKATGLGDCVDLEIPYKHYFVGWTFYIPGKFSILITDNCMKCCGDPGVELGECCIKDTRDPATKAASSCQAVERTHIQGDKALPLDLVQAPPAPPTPYIGMKGLSTIVVSETLHLALKPYDGFLINMGTNDYMAINSPPIPNSHNPTGINKAVVDKYQQYPGLPAWHIKDTECLFEMKLLQNPLLKSSGGVIWIDLREHISFSVRLLARQPKGEVMMQQTLLKVSNSNPRILRLSRSFFKELKTQTYDITVQPTGIGIGQSTVSVRMVSCSVTCNTPCSQNFLFLVSREPGRTLTIRYPVKIPDNELIDHDGVGVLRNDTIIYRVLPINYRPPSLNGPDIPTSSNIYHADPSKPKYKDWFKISKETGEYKQCLNRATREECSCSMKQRLTDDPIYSDCKELVYEVKRVKEFEIRVDYIPIMLPASQHPQFYIPYPKLSVWIEEINGRTDYSLRSNESEYIKGINSNKTLHRGRKFYDASQLKFTCYGTGLYHFKAALGEFDSFGDVSGYFTVYSEDLALDDVIALTVSILTLTICYGLLFCGFLRVKRRLMSHLPSADVKKNN